MRRKSNAKRCPHSPHPAAPSRVADSPDRSARTGVRRSLDTLASAQVDERPELQLQAFVFRGGLRGGILDRPQRFHRLGL